MPGYLFAGLHPEAKRDHVREVFDHLNARVIATKRDLGVKPAGPAATSLDSTRRKEIGARIKAAGRGDPAAGVEACKRVIAVYEAEARAQGPRGDVWNFWNAVTPFRAKNFDRKLGCWREDGRHLIHGGGRDTPPAQRDSDFGTSERHATNDYERRVRIMGEA